MTARGGRQHQWTSAEYAYVLENAGKVPPREIRRHLKVSKSQLDHACQRMRSWGCPVSLRCYEPRLAVCPHCGRPSAKIGRAHV